MTNSYMCSNLPGMDLATIQPSPYQRILNLDYPPSAGRVPLREYIRVEVRLASSADGEEWIRTSANGWTTTHVLILLHDKRTVANIFWVDATDQRRAICGKYSDPRRAVVGYSTPEGLPDREPAYL